MANWTLHHGDCLEVLPSIPSGSVDAVVTDPPYSVSVAGAVHVGRNGYKRRLDFFAGDTDWQAMTDVVVQAAKQCVRIIKPGGSMYWWIGHRQMGPLVSLFEGCGYSTRFLVWSKKCPVPPPPNAGWPSGAELCLYVYPKGRKWRYRPGEVPKSNVIVSDSYRHGQPGKVGHPTQKPLAVIEPLLRASTDFGDVVLDPFAGSGTTLIACANTGRVGIGIEKDAGYHAIARKRLEDAEAKASEMLPLQAV